MRAIFLLLIISLGLTLSGCTVLRNPAERGYVPDENCNTCAPKRKGKKACCPEEIGDCCAIKDICEDVREPLVETGCVETQLIKTAKSIERSLSILAAAQISEDPPIISTAPLVTPEGNMGGHVDIDWTGPVGPLMDRIARMTDYRIKVLGNEPAIPIIVTITGRRLIIADVVQNASYQAAKRAHILVFPCNRVIELRYIS